MASAKKIFGVTAIVLGVAGVIYLGANDWPEFARMKKVKELYKLPERMDKIDERVTVVENQIDTLEMWDEWFEYEIDSLGNVVDSSLVRANHADSVANRAARDAARARRDARKAQATADSARAAANRALDCCNGNNNAGRVNNADTTTAVEPRKPNKPAKPSSNNGNQGNGSQGNSSNQGRSNQGGSNRPAKPARHGNNNGGQSQSQSVVIINNGGTNVATRPNSTQQTLVVINGDTVFFGTEQVARELNANAVITYDTIRQRVR